MEGESGILARREGALGWLILNRPEKLNAFNLAMWRELPARLGELEADGAVRAIILRGAGEKAFGAGADIAEFERHRNDPAAARVYDEMNDLAFRAIRLCSKPTIAMVRGFCVGGGCAVALCADIRLASSDAKFALTPARLGLGYPYRGVEHVVRELGPATTRYLFLTAAQVGAAKALELGIVQEVVAPEAIEARARELAVFVAENAPLTLRAIKESVRQSLLPPQLRDEAEAERQVAECFKSEDYREGLRAFAEKRKPRFQGR